MGSEKFQILRVMILKIAKIRLLVYDGLKSLKLTKGITMMNPRLSSLPVATLRARVGETVMTQEMGGSLIMGKLVRVNVQQANPKAVQSIVVNENGKDVVWPTQWAQAVFA